MANQARASMSVGKLLDDRLEPLEQILPPGLVIGAVLVEPFECVEIKGFAMSDVSGPFTGFLEELLWPAWGC